MSKRKPIRISTQTTDAIAEILEAGYATQGNMHFENLPLKKIKLDPENPRDLVITLEDMPNGPSEDDPLYERKMLEFQELQAFADEIKEDGIIQPITVYPSQDHYLLISGERRSLASTLAGLTHIPANIRQKPNEYKIARLQWNENISRKDLSLWERILGVKRLFTAYTAEVDPNATWSASLIAKLANCSEETGRLYLKAIQAPTYLMEAIKEGALNNLKKVATITKMPNKVAQLQAVERLRAGEPIDGLIKRAGQQAANTQQNKPSATKQPQKVGRCLEQVTLGKTKCVPAIKIIFESAKLHPITKPIIEELGVVNWNDLSEVNKSFKKFWATLESRVSKGQEN